MKKLSLLILISVLTLLIASGCSKQVFNGNRTSNDSQFVMDYTVLSRTETHNMKLEKDTVVNVVIENKSGRLDIVVADAGGREIYKSNNAISGNFSIQIPRSDTYKFSVTGNKAKGSVSFKVAK
jgi:hypothetical protein